MTYHISPGLMDAFPGVDELLTQVKRIACHLDRDIRVRDLRVEARKDGKPRRFYGWAYPLTRHRDGHGMTRHNDGLIRMRIGAECAEEDVIRLYAHELRHIGQFHRARQRFGTMGAYTAPEAESEADAIAFEDRVLVRV